MSICKLSLYICYNYRWKFSKNVLLYVCRSPKNFFHPIPSAAMRPICENEFSLIDFAATPLYPIPKCVPKSLKKKPFLKKISSYWRVLRNVVPLFCPFLIKTLTLASFWLSFPKDERRPQSSSFPILTRTLQF